MRIKSKASEEEKKAVMAMFRKEVKKVPFDMDKISALLEKLDSPEPKKLSQIAYHLQFWEQVQKIDLNEKEIDTMLKRLNLTEEERLRRIAKRFGTTTEEVKRKLTLLGEQVVSNPIMNEQLTLHREEVFSNPIMNEQLILVGEQVTIDHITNEQQQLILLEEPATIDPIMNEQQLILLGEQVTLNIVDDDDYDDVGCSYAPRKKRKQFVFNDPEFFSRCRLNKGVTINDEPIDIMKKKKSRISTTSPSPPNLLPDITFDQFENMFKQMNGVDLKLVIKKKLFGSDCETGEGRLSIPLKQIISDDFLTDEEKAFLNTRKANGRRKEEIGVVVFDTKGITWPTMRLRKWDMLDKNNKKKSNPMYVLVKLWNQMRENNELKVDDLIELWSFRKDSNLHFGVLMIERK